MHNFVLFWGNKIVPRLKSSSAAKHLIALRFGRTLGGRHFVLKISQLSKPKLSTSFEAHLRSSQMASSINPEPKICVNMTCKVTLFLSYCCIARCNSRQLANHRIYVCGFEKCQVYWFGCFADSNRHHSIVALDKYLRNELKLFTLKLQMFVHHPYSWESNFGLRQARQASELLDNSDIVSLHLV